MLYTKSEITGRFLTPEELNKHLNSINFNCGGKEIISLRENGDIYVKGKLIENDKEVVEGFRQFLRQQHLL